MVSQLKGKKIPLGCVRRAFEDDIPEIEALITNSTKGFFFYCDIEDVKKLIKTCVLSICQLDAEENVVGFVALTDHPRVPHLHPSAWEEYIWARYKVMDMNARNTLFIHLLCWTPCVNCKEIAQSLLRSVFMHDLYLQFVCMINQHPETMQLDPDDINIASMFKRTTPIQGMRGVSMSKLPALMALPRSEMSPRLRIRRAVEEDNDDIIPIVELQSTRLRELYGDFYVSELVSRHPESNRVLLVCEYDELAVGVMILNTQINYEVLQENFDLSPYNGLVSPNVDTSASLLDSHITSGPHLGEQVGLQEDSACNFEGPVKYQGHVSFGEHDWTEMSRMGKSLGEPGDMGSRWRYLSVLEEEDLDFDIVNIDRRLLSVPHSLSSYSSYYGFSSDLTLGGLEEAESLTALTGKSGQKGSKLRPGGSFRWYTEGKGEFRKYCGRPDAFIIELFAMNPEIDERHGFDILEVTFEMFPDRRYCVLALPTDHVSYPLLEHFTLVTPFTFRNRMVDQSLYVAHRNSVRGKISIRSAEICDVSELERILKFSPRRPAIVDKYKESLTSRSECTYMLLSEKKPIGLVMLGPLQDKEIHSRYRVTNDDIAQGLLSGVVTEAVLAPALEPHARWFIRELLRHTEYDELFWSCRLAARGDAMPGRNLISLMGRMVPTMPRRPVPDLTLKKNNPTIKLSDYGVWHISRPLTSAPKVDINHSIVVVGASTTGLAFIETLLFGPSCSYLTFTNITLVSTHGLPIVREKSEFERAANLLVPCTGRFHGAYFKSVPFNFYIDIIDGTMVQIDRKKKCIVLQDGGVKYYDDLYLTYGLQFQHPHHLRVQWMKEERLKLGMLCDHAPMDEPEYTGDALPAAPFLPSNMLIVNDILDAHRTLRRVKSILDISPVTVSVGEAHEVSTVVVYGACVEALCCVAALLDMGLPPHRMSYVEPFPSADPTVLRVQHFNNELVDTRVQAMLNSTGVHCYRGYSLSGWSEYYDGRVKIIKLLSKHHYFELPCLALLYYGEKTIDLDAFAAMNASGLVYDGGLVVEPQLFTNDPHIMAAGPATKYSRQLHADQFLHRYYRSEDIGAELGEMVLNRLDPFRAGGIQAGAKGDSSPLRPSSFSDRYPSLISSEVQSTCSKFKTKTKFRPQTVLKFKSPLMLSCTLPGGLHYLHVRKPGPEVPAAITLSMDLKIKGHTLTTDMDGNYFCLQLDAHHVIVEITCLSQVQFHAELLTQLYGKHEQMFNNLLLRYQAGLIEDLYEYFSGPWLTALYREDFADLLAEIDNRIVLLEEENLGTIKDIIAKMISKFDFPWTVNKHLSEVAEVTEVEFWSLLLDWLKNRTLPMYAVCAK